MRLFVAVRPPETAVDHLRAVLPRWPSDPGRWHLTLAFLGDLADPAAVDAGLAEVSAHHEPFGLSLAGSGTFGRGGPVWLGVTGDLPALRALGADVADACRRAGAVLEDRPYQPHLTVGRRGHPDPRSLATYAGPSWQVTELELVRSHLGRTAVHETLARHPLTGRP